MKNVKLVKVQIDQEHTVSERIDGELKYVCRKVGDQLEVNTAEAQSLHRKRFGHVVKETKPEETKAKAPAKKAAKKAAKKKAK
tara:strand:- start:12451 stop:12699 length:249 start_codon:yes stop_codon:yes gene_type:complete